MLRRMVCRRGRRCRVIRPGSRARRLLDVAAHGKIKRIARIAIIRRFLRKRIIVLGRLNTLNIPRIPRISRISGKGISRMDCGDTHHSPHAHPEREKMPHDPNIPLRRCFIAITIPTLAEVRMELCRDILRFSHWNKMWQINHYQQPMGTLILGADLTAMQRNSPAANRQTNTRPPGFTRPRIVDAIKRIEQMG